MPKVLSQDYTGSTITMEAGLVVAASEVYLVLIERGDQLGPGADPDIDTSGDATKPSYCLMLATHYNVIPVTGDTFHPSEPSVVCVSHSAEIVAGPTDRTPTQAAIVRIACEFQRVGIVGRQWPLESSSTVEQKTVTVDLKGNPIFARINDQNATAKRLEVSVDAAVTDFSKTLALQHGNPQAIENFYTNRINNGPFNKWEKGSVRCVRLTHRPFNYRNRSRTLWHIYEFEFIVAPDSQHLGHNNAAQPFVEYRHDNDRLPTGGEELPGDGGSTPDEIGGDKLAGFEVQAYADADFQALFDEGDLFIGYPNGQY